MNAVLAPALGYNDIVEWSPRRGVINRAEKRFLDLLAIPPIKDLPQGARDMASPWGTPRAVRQERKPKIVQGKLAFRFPKEPLPRSKESTHKQQDRHYRRAYGISQQDYSDMLAAQGGVCAICHQPPMQKGGRHGTTLLRLAVDHDHKTGEVRGLLCGRCNTGLGSFVDNSELLRAAIAYLDAQPVLVQTPICAKDANRESSGLASLYITRKAS